MTRIWGICIPFTDCSTETSTNGSTNAVAGGVFKEAEAKNPLCGSNSVPSQGNWYDIDRDGLRCEKR
jgi:hypothetical protein